MSTTSETSKDPEKPLPCGCTRKQILIQNLATIQEAPTPNSFAFPGSTATFSSTSASQGLERADTDFNIPLPIEETDTIQFKYYLPHISTSTSDFYTDCEWIAYDQLSPNEEAETEALFFASSPSTVDLPFIARDSFIYYPPEPVAGELPRRSTEEDMVAERDGPNGLMLRRGDIRSKKFQQKKHWGGFTPEGKVGGLLAAFGRMKLGVVRKVKFWKFKP
jgi:hypothetical protein